MNSVIGKIVWSYERNSLNRRVPAILFYARRRLHHLRIHSAAGNFSSNSFSVLYFRISFASFANRNSGPCAKYWISSEKYHGLGSVWPPISTWHPVNTNEKSSMDLPNQRYSFRELLLVFITINLRMVVLKTDKQGGTSRPRNCFDDRVVGGSCTANLKLPTPALR